MRANPFDAEGTRAQQKLRHVSSAFSREGESLFSTINGGTSFSTPYVLLHTRLRQVFRAARSVSRATTSSERCSTTP
jgi:hypothetical protein